MPNINISKITAIPIVNITAPVEPKAFIKGTATAAPIAPPPISFSPK